MSYCRVKWEVHLVNVYRVHTSALTVRGATVHSFTPLAFQFSSVFHAFSPSVPLPDQSGLIAGLVVSLLVVAILVAAVVALVIFIIYRR